MPHDIVISINYFNSTGMNFFSKLFNNKPAVDYRQLINNGGLILDVRSKQEYAQGHIKGSVNLPLGELGNHIATLKEKHRAVITVCQSGARSSMATALLVKYNIEAYNAGGWLGLERTLN